MTYRTPHDELRARIELVEREIERARAERARLPALRGELRELRARLEGRSARRRWAPGIAAGAIALLLVSGAALGFRRPIGPPPAPAPIVPLAQSTLSPEQEACARRLLRAPDFHVISDFERVSGDLRLTWTLSSSRRRPRPGPPLPSNDEMTVRLGLAAGVVSHVEVLGQHAGQAYPADITFCREVPLGGPCAMDPRPPPPPGVLAELSVWDCAAYSCSGSVSWMVVRAPSSALVLRARDHGRPHEDRQICEPDAWQVVLEIPLGPGARVIEEVQHGDPPKPFDCTAWGDARCTG